MKKFLLLTILFTSFIEINAQQITGTRKQLIQQIRSLSKELSDLKILIEQNTIPLSDTITVNDTLNFSAIYDDYVFEQPIPLNTDSLLSVFYLQHSLHHNSMDNFFDIDSIPLVADLPDSVYIRRLTALNSFIPLPYNPIVKSYIVHYTQKMPERIATILGLSTYYMPIFQEIFDQNDLPLELTIMAVIESALNPTAVSRAKARGMWQFMHRTGLQYNLTINSYVDERYDPVTSGHAAARYLKDSYLIFEDWLLAIASYNCGAGNVNKAIRRANSHDFWNIYPYLPKETRGYVPSFVAALYTLTYFREHGIKPFRIDMPTHLDTLHVTKRLHFAQISDCIGISIDELRDLNPQYLHDIIPGKPYILRLPHQYASLFVDKEKEIYTYKDSIYFNPILLEKNTLPAITSRSQLVHTVKSGETLGSIARKYGVKTSDLQYWNNLKGTTIRIGQRLAVYAGKAPAATASAGTSTPASNASANNTASTGHAANTTYLLHTIQKGESLMSIAQNYKISLNDLLELNDLNNNSKIIAGKQLRVKRL